MNDNSKKVLIVDDSEIDREVLKSILCDEFQVTEAVNGYEGLEIILSKKNEIDAILLDVSMPVLDGFGVLGVMKQNNIRGIPVFLITAEATEANVKHAVEFNISEFIKKPFDREEILRRLKEKLRNIEYMELSKEDVLATRRYIFNFKELYKKYLVNFNRDTGHYMRMVGLMKILLNKYAASNVGVQLGAEEIEVISEAAFFCDIGFMLLQGGLRGNSREEMNGEQYQSHTSLGAELVRLNGTKECEYFVSVCADMCENHHERYDGGGFPNRIAGKNNSIYTQMCRLVDEFDYLYYKYKEHNELQFDFVMGIITMDKGAVSPEVISLLADIKFNIVAYYGIS